MKRYALYATGVVGGAILYPTTPHAGLFDSIGKTVGGFFRSVGNVFGQGLAGLAQPTIDDTANQMQRVGMSLVEQADRVAGKRIEQISEKISQAIEKTDEILQRQLAALDELLSKKLGAVDIIGAKQIFNFEQSAISVVRYASLMAVVAALFIIVGVYLFKRLSADNYEKMGVRPWAVAATIVFVLSGMSFVTTTIIRPPSQGRLNVLRSDLLKSYRYASQLGDLSGATYYASQLNVLDSSQLGTRLLVELTDLQRDLLSRPALLKTVRGSLELNSRAARLDRTWDLISEQKLGFNDLEFLPNELSATAAMIVWQTARVERDELAAACAAATALRDFNAASGSSAAENGSPFVWLAYSYARWAAVRTAGSSYECDDKQKLSAKLQLIQPALANFDKSRPNPVVEQAVLYNRLAIRYYAAVSRSYSRMIVADTQYRWKANKAPYQIERDLAADEISAAWAEFLTAVQQIPGAKGSNMVLAINGLPLGLAQRAASLKGSDPAARPAFDAGACSATIGQMANPDPAARLAAEKTRFGQFLALFDPGIQQFVCNEQAATDARIVLFENTIVSSVTKAGVDPILERGKMLENPEFASFARSLMACTIFAPDISGDRGCKPGEVGTEGTLAEWLDPKAPKIADDKVQRVAFVR